MPPGGSTTSTTSENGRGCSVGYGDLYPVTVTGRVIAALLMLGGISLVGVVTASLASWMVQRVAEADTANRAVTAARIEAVPVLVESEVPRACRRDATRRRQC